MSRTRSGAEWAWVGVVLSLGGLSACSLLRGSGDGAEGVRRGESASSAPTDGESEGAPAGSPQEGLDLEAYAEAASRQVLEALAAREAGGEPVADPGGVGTSASVPGGPVASDEPSSGVDGTMAREGSGGGGEAPSPVGPGRAEAEGDEGTPARAPGVEERTREAARWLEAAALAEVRASGAPDLAGVARLAALAAFGRAGAGELLAGEVGEYLPPEELAAAEGIAGLLGGVVESASLARPLLEAADRVARAMPMRIAGVVLCRSVEGFGQYEPLPGHALLAGRSHPMIVYSEIEHFGHRERREGEGKGGRWAVEVSQELNLYHDDGTLAWREAEQVLVDTSNRRRRDFYLVQRIALPPTLTVGRYTLKVIVRDKTTDGVDEAIVPIEVVADADLASR